MGSKAICIGGRQNLQYVVSPHEYFHTPDGEIYIFGEIHITDHNGNECLRKIWRLNTITFKEAKEIFEARY